ncbi:hypothetical protein Poly51_25380 [Rubripirellula tenax]|uniref:Uncharacterized protein n=1 Tax=Rubripirellula tenax TaxID=2528015 RepID=A0A5C6F6L2_9BACT|nr:hypothetical protein [Rubripirellula tenax]TWU56622.1 hypothetical protein Poly51_25380 [Rubripirellula tenax]
MPKFYAQSGSRSIIISAENAFEAATKLVDHVMDVHVWIYGEPTLSEDDRRAHLAIESLLTMDTEINVSIRGEGRSDAGTFQVADLVHDWHRLMTATAIMFGQMV